MIFRKWTVRNHNNNEQIIPVDENPKLERKESNLKVVCKLTKLHTKYPFKVGKKGDLWFHANDVPGAHVILKMIEGEISEDYILTGARLAAINSFAKRS